ncbi:MAG: hypothetical protein Q8P80_03600 [Candidatus Levybacteria bacterium]|nr:hypothetical protein [Candidatus Levybacteria bacterium]
MKQREILFILISTLILVLMWIGFNIYHNAKTSTIPQTLSIQISPINPTFDMETIERLKNREKVQPVFEVQNKASAASSASPSGTQLR